VEACTTPLLECLLVCPRLKLELRFSSELPSTFQVLLRFPTLLALRFRVCIILLSLLVFQNSFGVISEPLRLAGRLLTPSDSIDSLTEEDLDSSLHHLGCFFGYWLTMQNDRCFISL